MKSTYSINAANSSSTTEVTLILLSAVTVCTKVSTTNLQLIGYFFYLGKGRSTVKGRMGHVSTSFCKSKDNFDRFWEHTLKESKELRIEDPKLKRKEKIPKKIANFIHQD